MKRKPIKYFRKVRYDFGKNKLLKEPEIKRGQFINYQLFGLKISNSDL